MTHTELETTLRKVAERCYHKIVRAENDKLLQTGKELTVIERLDIFQGYRDKAFQNYAQEMFFLDFYDLFDRIYKEVEAEHDWEEEILISASACARREYAT